MKHMGRRKAIHTFLIRHVCFIKMKRPVTTDISRMPSARPAPALVSLGAMYAASPTVASTYWLRMKGHVMSRMATSPIRSRPTGPNGRGARANIVRTLRERQT